MPRGYSNDPLETRQLRRMRHEDKMLGKLEKREEAASHMIGELCKEGRTVYYVWPVGGRYREGQRHELIAFLIRNNYA